ncbi:MAG: small ribosomal subunit Rsm22 family protein [Treponema sp.]|nr:small ribosomal subunit Rsm22 family protein [Treponema sp.]
MILSKTSLFDKSNISADSMDILENFDSIVQSVRPLNSKQLQQLPHNIKEFSHQLTDERGSRRLGYMNEAIQLSVYTRYYLWWNLVRQVRLFSNLNASAFPSKDEVIALDIGTGPLTVVTALWLARPELRTKKITWYVMDVSQNSMKAGEDIFLSVAAKTKTEPWKIIRVKGSFGTHINQKADFITCGNAMNEMEQASDMPPEYKAKKLYEQLKSYAAPDCKYLMVEPGVPKSARLLSLFRSRFIKDGFSVQSPCPHAGECPMNGFKAYTGSQNKWCNFAFSTEDAPKKLLKLSDMAKLPKERAVLSFISAVPENAGTNAATPLSNSKEPGTLTLRIASDPLKLPGWQTGFYACSELGLTLVTMPSPGNRNVKPGEKLPELTSGDLLAVKLNKKTPDLPKDEKSGAVKINLSNQAF